MMMMRTKQQVVEETCWQKTPWPGIPETTTWRWTTCWNRNRKGEGITLTLTLFR